MPGMILFLTLLQQIGISLAIGSSTFALIFYFKSIRDGRIDDSERSFMHTVYLVLRIGLVTIVISELLSVFAWYDVGSVERIVNATFWFKWTLLAIIVGNALLMDTQMMPMWLGPGIAGGSWYMFVIAHTLRPLEAHYFTWIFYYLVFVILFVAFLHLVRMVYVDHSFFSRGVGES